MSLLPDSSLQLPDWSRNLMNYYVVIRIDGRNKTIRRRWYRKIEKEKLRLAELGVYQPHIIAVARYLSTLNRTVGIKLVKQLREQPKQLVLFHNYVI